MQHQLLGRLDLRRHVGEPERHRLMLDDRLAELDALLGVGQRRVMGGARHADRLGGDADAAAFQVGERDLEPLPFLAEALARRHAHLLEREGAGVGGVLAELLLDLGDDEAGRVGRHDEGGNALLAGLRVGDGEDDRHVGVLARGDELLGAREDIGGIAVAPRPRLDRGGVGARAGLGQAEAADLSPRAMGLRNRSRCSSSPKVRIGMQPTPLWTLMMVETAPQPAAISITAMA